MPLPDQTPKLPKWPFLLIDLVLLGVAWGISSLATNKFAAGPLLGIVACVGLAAIAFAYPFVIDHARAQEEILDERQRALDSLARTVTASAEQISIATNGLKEIAELTQKSLRHAEHLPQKVHEKIGEIQAQLASVSDAEKDELEREVAALRAAESDRLESTSDKIAKSTAEWAKLEAATQKHLAAATDALAKAQAQAASAFDAKLNTALAALDAKIAALTAAAKNISAAPAPAAPAAEATTSVEVSPPPVTISTDPAAKPEGAAHPPKRPRKPRRPEAAPEEAPAADPNQKLEEPPPVPSETIPHVAPVAPQTVEPFVAPAAPPPAAEEPPAKTDEAAAPDVPKPPRKRAAKKPAPVDGEPSLGLDEPPAPAPVAEVTERAISSDGATRLLVTAYIGIGNRLFIRGDGPGLSWDKGVPLQFVSIGKWRWETSAATSPVKFKLYKNDDVECTALGAQSLDPGQQQEMTAAF